MRRNPLLNWIGSQVASLLRKNADPEGSDVGSLYMFSAQQLTRVVNIDENMYTRFGKNFNGV
jgi:hypothetical protein